MNRAITLAVAAWITLAGCQTSSEAPFAPARAAELSPAELDALRGIVAEALGLDSVRLSAQVFTRSHILTLEPAIGNTPQGRIATGRTSTRPETFHLLTNGDRCELLHVGSGRRYAVGFSCSAAQG